jgi:hypothetical protein
VFDLHGYKLVSILMVLPEINLELMWT